jgi:hypothetical protein
MKLEILDNKCFKSRRINVRYNIAGNSKCRNKIFNHEAIKEAMDFAESISDIFIQSCASELKEWIIVNKHTILLSKNWCFA